MFCLTGPKLSESPPVEPFPEDNVMIKQIKEQDDDTLIDEYKKGGGGSAVRPRPPPIIGGGGGRGLASSLYSSCIANIIVLVVLTRYTV